MKLGLMNDRTPCIIYDDEPDIAVILATAIRDGLSAEYRLVQGTRDDKLFVQVEVSVGEYDFAAYFVAPGNELIIEAMVRQRVIVLLPELSTTDTPTVPGLPLRLDNGDVDLLRRVLLMEPHSQESFDAQHPTEDSG